MDFIPFFPWILIPIIGVIAIIIMAMLRKVVPPNKIDIVIRKNSSTIYCANKEYFIKPKRDPETGLVVPHTQEELKDIHISSVYYHIPSWVPGFGMYVRRLPLEMMEIKVPNFVAFDENRARFECDIVAFCAIVDGTTASMRMPESYDALQKQVQQVLWATMRDSTTKMTVRTIINNRRQIIDSIRDPLKEALDEWGLGLKDIEIIEFKDAPNTKVVSNISSIREQEIETEARQKNADQIMKARLVEAESDEKARMREIKRDEEVSKREQDKLKFIATQEKEARREMLEVTKVEKVKNQQIEKEKAEVLAEQQRAVAKIDAQKRREVEAVNKEQKQLEGEGDKLRRMEQAKGEASPVREMGLAEADIIMKKLLAEAKGKQELQKALNQFGDNAIRALTAIREIEKDEEIYSRLADAVKYADTKVFMGGGAGEDSFKFGQSMEGLLTGSGPTGTAMLNRLAQPNDLGFEKKDWIKMAVALSKNPELKEQVREEMDKLADEEKQETPKVTQMPSSQMSQEMQDYMDEWSERVETPNEVSENVEEEEMEKSSKKRTRKRL